jgi:hypothetical protein
MSSRSQLALESDITKELFTRVANSIIQNRLWPEYVNRLPRSLAVVLKGKNIVMVNYVKDVHIWSQNALSPIRMFKIRVTKNNYSGPSGRAF